MTAISSKLWQHIRLKSKLAVYEEVEAVDVGPRRSSQLLFIMELQFDEEKKGKY